MKAGKIAAISFIMLLSSIALADDECTQSCDNDYKDCKAVAESTTAKQACEDDIKQCKADCSKT